jgi:hypothetical protein
MASTYLTRTFSAGNQKTWTWSFWTKIPNYDASNNKAIFSGYNDANNVMKIQFTNTDQFQSYGLSSGTLVCRLVTNQLFRDYNAWYHIVYSLDTTQSTSTDRQKLWVNGEEVTSFSTRTDPSQNADLQINNTIGHQIGASNNADHYSNCMAHCHFIDGTAYDADTFGETDATTGIWKPKTAPSVTYGTNGFFLKFENSGAFGTDSSGNANNFTVNGTMTQTVDTPSNVFATWNPLTTLKGNNSSLSNGNTTLIDTGTTDTDGRNYSTIGASSGKWYFEIKASAFSNNNHTIGVSFSDGDVDANSGDAVKLRYTTSDNTNYIRSFGTIVQSNLTSFSAGSIIGIAVDLDNGTVQFYVNGSTYGSQVTGLSGSIANRTMFVQSNGEGGAGRTFTLNANFGNGYFGTTAVSSAENPDDGIGIFEYTVPTGYKALCTKSINAQEYS